MSGVVETLKTSTIAVHLSARQNNNRANFDWGAYAAEGVWAQLGTSLGTSPVGTSQWAHSGQRCRSGHIPVIHPVPLAVAPAVVWAHAIGSFAYPPFGNPGIPVRGWGFPVPRDAFPKGMFGHNKEVSEEESIWRLTLLHSLGRTV